MTIRAKDVKLTYVRVRSADTNVAGGGDGSRRVIDDDIVGIGSGRCRVVDKLPREVIRILRRPATVFSGEVIVVPLSRPGADR